MSLLAIRESKMVYTSVVSVPNKKLFFVGVVGYKELYPIGDNNEF